MSNVEIISNHVVNNYFIEESVTTNNSSNLEQKEIDNNSVEVNHISNDEEEMPANYWVDVSQYKAIFDKFEALKMSTKLSTPQVVRTMLKNTDYLEDPFYIIDLSRVVRQFLQWKKLLPRVSPFYAIKCNPSPCLIQLIDALGGSFDCASMKEIDTVIANANKLLDEPREFIPKDRIIFANPCKQISNIKHAKNIGVELTTVDNEYELRKIAQHWPNAKVVIRIKTDDSHSICQFSTKFGASVDKGDVKKLLTVGKELGLNLYGVSFHVGSGCMSTQSYVDALKNARRVFDMAEHYGYKMQFLDIGGGFPGINVKGFPTFVEIAAAIRPVLDELFAEDVQIIGEPGRYFACASHTLVCNIFAKRNCTRTNTIMTPSDDNPSTIAPDFMYYINDGMYGSFNCLFYDHAEVSIRHLPRDESFENKLCDNDLKVTTIYGPTCDSIDCIKKNALLPEMEIGDYLYFSNFGAYTVAAGSDFNGFKTNTTFYIWKN